MNFDNFLEICVLIHFEGWQNQILEMFIKSRENHAYSNFLKRPIIYQCMSWIFLEPRYFLENVSYHLLRPVFLIHLMPH